MITGFSSGGTSVLWKSRSSRRFIRNRFIDASDLLAQDGITGWRAKRSLVWYLVGKPGILRRVFPAWCAYFLPGFHPWNRDDRHLIAQYDRGHAAAAAD